jgi:thioredoxin reductase (NADPH)
MEEALFLTRFASKVYVLHRSDNYRASHIMLERARANPKIEFLSNVTVQEVLGVENKEVNGIALRHTKTGESSTLPLSGMFLGIGHEPNTKPFVGQIELDSDGYVITHEDVHTRVGGVFACGDVQDRRYRQAITAAGSGCAAALEAEKYLEEQGR